jgi:hypothetical protein
MMQQCSGVLTTTLSPSLYETIIFRSVDHAVSSDVIMVIAVSKYAVISELTFCVGSDQFYVYRVFDVRNLHFVVFITINSSPEKI